MKPSYLLQLATALCALVFVPSVSATTISSADGFSNTAFAAAQSGTFTATVDAVPSISPSNTTIALCQGAQTSYTTLACIARFNTSGNIDARNGGAYSAASTIPFSAGVSYHFRFVVNVPAHTYSIYVTPAGGAEIAVGLNYGFRTEVNTVTSLDTWNVDVNATPGGSVTFTNLSVTSASQVATPTFSPGGGTYSSAQSVTISTTTSGASIRYTTDGSTPTPTTGTLYSGPVSVSTTTTLKAIAYATGATNSAVASATYTINISTGTTITAANGFYNTAFGSTQSGSFTATIDAKPSLSPSNTTIGLCQGAQTAYTGIACVVRFNTSGNIDARNGAAYAAASTIPFSAGVSYHFRFVVNVPAHTYSIFVTPAGGSEITVGSNYAFRTEVNTVTSLDTWNVDVNATPGGSVNINNLSVSGTPTAAAPTFTPAAGTYSSAQSVTISTTTSGASIRYTTDGSTPSSTAGTLYSGPISISATTTVKAIAYASGLANSAVSSATYTIGTRNYTPAEVLPAIQQRMVSTNQVNTKAHINTMTRASNVNVYQVKTGVFAYTSSMAIDTDGSDPDPDPDHQGVTTWQDDSGRSLGAHHVAFYVLGDYCYDKVSPCPHFYYAEHNITGLQFALVFYNGKCIGAIFGDTQGDSVTPTSDNDSRELGEASVHAASMLGIPSSGTTGGVDNGVTVVIFSGSTWVIHGTDSTTINTNAQAVVQKALNTLGSAWGL
jgi:hypothetical protein